MYMYVSAAGIGFYLITNLQLCLVVYTNDWDGHPMQQEATGRHEQKYCCRFTINLLSIEVTLTPCLHNNNPSPPPHPPPTISLCAWLSAPCALVPGCSTRKTCCKTLVSVTRVAMQHYITCVMWQTSRSYANVQSHVQVFEVVLWRHILHHRMVQSRVPLHWTGSHV